MALLSDVLTFSRAQAQTDTNGLTNANGIVFANEALFDYRRRLMNAGVDASQLQESYADFTAGTGTYLYPTNNLWLKAIELNYADSTENNYKTAQQVDVSNLNGQVSFSWLRKNASKIAPQFDDRGDWFEVFPTPQTGDNLSQAIRIFYFLKPTEYSAVGDTISYPESIDYRILGWRIAASYLKSLMKIDEGNAFLVEYENRVKQLIQTLARGTQQPIQATEIPWSGFEF